MNTPIAEPLTLPIQGSNVYTMHPITKADIWAMYKKMQASRWVAEEIILDVDMQHWPKLSDSEQHFIKTVLGFFAASDGIVSFNLLERFFTEVQCATTRAAYAEQLSIEQVHSEVYSLLIEKYVSDPKEKHELFNAIEYHPAIKRKAEWALRWINDKEASFAQRMVAFAIVEGVFFAGSFCAIFWLREKGLMPGLTHANSMIARDEGMHTDLAANLYREYIVNKLSQETVESMIREAVAIEDEFINVAVPCKLVGMNSELMSDYIRFVSDRILLQLGHSPVFNTKNGFPFMERAGMVERVNFFEARNHNYSMATSVNDRVGTAIKADGNDDF